MFVAGKQIASQWIAVFSCAALLAGCERSSLVTDATKSRSPAQIARSNSLQRPARPPIPVVPEVIPISERFAALVPEFAGAYRGPNNTLVIRVTDPGLLRSGGQVAARGLLQRELTAYGRGELAVSFSGGAQYDYRTLKSWLDKGLDSLGAYRATSWSINQVTGRIQVGLPNAASQHPLQAAIAKLGVPLDAVEMSVDPGDSLFQCPALGCKVRPTIGGTVIQTHEWALNGSHAWGPCTLTGVFLQGTYPEFLTAAHCVIATAQGGDQDWMVYQNPTVGDGYCQMLNHGCIGSIDDNPPFQQGLAGCPTGAYCRNSDAASGFLISCGGSLCTYLLGTVARTLTGPVALPDVMTPGDIDTTTNISLQGAAAVFMDDTLSKVGAISGWTKGAVFAVDEARLAIQDNLYRLHTYRVRAASQGGDSGAPVLKMDSFGHYYLAGLLWGGGSDSLGQYFSISLWSYIQSELGFTSVK